MPAVFSWSALHDGATQTVSAAYLAQPPRPSQTPVTPHVEGSVRAQIARGSARPAATDEQVPARSLWLQLTQAPVQALLQQTPSTQKPDAHWLASVQLVPVICLPQLPLRHLIPGAQSPSDAQRVTQALAAVSQPNGAQIFTAPATQLPAPSHVRIPPTEAPLQVPAWQTLPAT